MANSVYGSSGYDGTFSLRCYCLLMLYSWNLSGLFLFRFVHITCSFIDIILKNIKKSCNVSKCCSFAHHSTFNMETGRFYIYIIINTSSGKTLHTHTIPIICHGLLSLLRPETLKLLLHHCPAERSPRSRWDVWCAKDANQMSNPGIFFRGSIGWLASLHDKQQKRLWKTPKWKEPRKGSFLPCIQIFQELNLLLVFRQKAYPICEPWVKYPGFKMVSCVC